MLRAIEHKYGPIFSQETETDKMDCFSSSILGLHVFMSRSSAYSGAPSLSRHVTWSCSWLKLKVWHFGAKTEPILMLLLPLRCHHMK